MVLLEIHALLAIAHAIDDRYCGRDSIFRLQFILLFLALFD